MILAAFLARSVEWNVKQKVVNSNIHSSSIDHALIIVIYRQDKVVVSELELEILDRCYNSKLGLDCNSSKDLSKSREDNKLVKYKDTELYLLLYIQ